MGRYSELSRAAWNLETIRVQYSLSSIENLSSVGQKTVYQFYIFFLFSSGPSYTLEVSNHSSGDHISDLKLGVEWSQVAWFLDCFNFSGLGPEFRQNSEHFLTKMPRNWILGQLGTLRLGNIFWPVWLAAFSLTLGMLCGKCSCWFYWKVLKSIVKYWKVLKSIEKYLKIFKSIEK